MNCTDLYRSKKVQRVKEKSFKKWRSIFMKTQGGLPPHFYHDFNNGFKKGFIHTCKNKTKKR